MEIILRKRKARSGEVGLFLDSCGVFDEEWSSLSHDVDIKAECTIPVNLKYQRFFHALCGKLAEAVEFFGNSKDFAKEQILLQCRHATYHHDKLRGTTQIKAKTTANLSSDEWIRLLKRANYVAVSEYLPGVPEGVLKAEIEKMLEPKDQHHGN